MRRSYVPAAFVLLLAILSGGWLLQEGVERERNYYYQARVFREVFERISDEYVEEVDAGLLYDHAIEAVVDALDDPNSVVFEPDRFEDFRIQTEGEYGGVGMEITERNGRVTVVSPIPGGPAEAAGIRAGDRIVGVEGESAESWSSERMAEALRGKPGSEVEIVIERPGVGSTIEFTLRRAEIVLRAVPYTAVLEEGIGYLPLQMVRGSSGEELRAAIDELRAAGVEKLILDLRGNPGGLLSQGVEITDLFLPEGKPIVETRGKEERERERYVGRVGDRFEGMPIVVLVDGQSASASEIVSGALQDHDRALVVGMPTFGKGSVQTLFPLTGGKVLKLTTALWYTPAGRSIERDRKTSEELSDSAFVVGVSGAIVPRPDLEIRPTVTSFGGRTLYGGGGIVPDLVVFPDTLSSEEKLAVWRIGPVAAAFHTAVFNYAVGYVQDHPSLSVDFELTDADLEAFRRSLEGWGVEIDEQTFRGAERYVRHHLGREIAHQKHGEEGEFHWLAPRDLQLQSALDLLREVSGQEALFELAAQEGATEGARVVGASAAVGAATSAPAG